jgi:hypothetical protein
MICKPAVKQIGRFRSYNFLPGINILRRKMSALCGFKVVGGTQYETVVVCSISPSSPSSGGADGGERPSGDSWPQWAKDAQHTGFIQVTGQPASIDKDHSNGYEWCINAFAIDAKGVAYANSEDGNVYVLNQGGKLQSKLFLQVALGAAYTPLSLGPDGKIYTQNDGVLFVVE